MRLVMHNHFTRVDTRLHRVTEVDEASAEENYIHPHDWRSNQGRVGQPPASKGEKVAGFILAVVLAILGAALLVHWSVQDNGVSYVQR